MIAAVHTSGVNWDQLAAQVAIATPFVAVVIYAVRRAWGNWSSQLGRRLDGQDTQIKDIRADASVARDKAEVTSMSVARIEGYMAAQNGGGHVLPPVP